MVYYLLALLGMILFGLEVVISKVCVKDIEPENVALIRCLCATLVIFAYTRFQREPLVISKSSGYACMAGIFLGLGFILMFKAMSLGPISVVAPIIGLSQLIPAIFGIFIFKEPWSIQRIIGIILGSIALFLISK